MYAAVECCVVVRFEVVEKETWRWGEFGACVLVSVKVMRVA